MLVAIGDPSSFTSFASKLGPSVVVSSASMSQYVAEVKATRALSRSTMMRVATLCTRPALSRGMTFFHRTGDTS